MSNEWDSFSHCTTGIPFSHTTGIPSGHTTGIPSGHTTGIPSGHTTGILPQGLPSVTHCFKLIADSADSIPAA